MLTGWWTADGRCKISLNPALQLQEFIPPFHHSTIPPFPLPLNETALTMKGAKGCLIQRKSFQHGNDSSFCAYATECIQGRAVCKGTYREIQQWQPHHIT
jgi:hypothetical protein